MMPGFKPMLLAAALPLAFAGCASTDPQAAFTDMGGRVTARTGQEVRWLRDDAHHAEIARIVATLLQTNLNARACVTIALLNNRFLQAEFESIGIAQADLAQASRLKNPEISGSWRLPTHPPTVVDAEFGLAQDFLDLLMLPARKKIAAQNLESVKLRVAQEVLKLSEATQVAFYNLQARQQFAQRLAIIVEINEAAADLAGRQHKAGNINELELFNQQAVHAQSRLEFSKVEAQVRSHRERLNRLLGLWGAQTVWQITDALPPLPREEPSLENLEAIAVSRRFDLAAARGDVMAVASALRLKRNFRYIPGATVGVDAEHDLDHSWIVGPNLKLEVPLFDQGQGQIAKLAAEYRRAQRTFEAVAVNIRSEVREARDALIAARDAAGYHTSVLLPQRQRILRETLLHYNAMQKSNFELLAAKEREQAAEREAIEALRDYWIARAELESAVGGGATGETQPLPSTMPSSKAEPRHHEPGH